MIPSLGPLSWLIGYMLAALAGSVVMIRIFDLVTYPLWHSAAEAVRFVVFGTTWTGITAASGMAGLNKKVAQAREVTSLLRDGLDAFAERNEKRKRLK